MIENQLIPLGNKIKLDIKEITHMGESTGAIQEKGTIIDAGTEVDDVRFPLEATLYFKAWAVDIITDGNEKHYFISADSDAICGIKFE